MKYKKQFKILKIDEIKRFFNNKIDYCCCCGEDRYVNTSVLYCPEHTKVDDIIIVEDLGYDPEGSGKFRYIRHVKYPKYYEFIGISDSVGLYDIEGKHIDGRRAIKIKRLIINGDEE